MGKTNLSPDEKLQVITKFHELKGSGSFVNGIITHIAEEFGRGRNTISRLLKIYHKSKDNSDASAALH